jgi:uncharacterized protein (TIGR00106 family)
VTIYPIGEGTSLGRFVQAAFRAMAGVRGLRLVPTAMSTTFEAPDLPTAFRAVGRAHAALVRMGAKRIAILVRVDHRLDKLETMEYKIRRVTAGPRGRRRIAR